MKMLLIGAGLILLGIVVGYCLGAGKNENNYYSADGKGL